MDGEIKQSWSFIEALIKYYKEFLETDFRSRFKPKRRVVLSREEGLAGIALSRYPGLNELVLDLLSKKFNVPKLTDIDEGEFAIYPGSEATESIDSLITKHGKVNDEKLIEEILDNFEDYLKKAKFLDEINLLYSRSELRSQLKAVSPPKYASVIRKCTLFDFYRDITVILQTKKLTDKTDFYFYFYDIKYDGETYPIFYIPVSIEHPSLLNGAKPHYSLNFEGSPIVYINEKVLQYISEKISESQKHKIKIDLPKRQLYWNEVEDIVETLNDVFTKISDRFELQHFTIGEKNIKVGHEDIKVTSNCYITVFDKADEAIINDYEELLLLLESDDAKALDIFNTLIKEFLLKNPKVVTLDVDEEFDKQGTSEKLTYRSPISLNSEQLKILEALKKDDVRSVIVEGPPGTGKSHTITAIIYDALLNNKSVLVASDKKEALDVVEEKISEVLEKIKVGDDGFVQNPILRLGQAENNFNKIFQTQNFEKIKTRFGAYKFNHEKTQSEISERIQQMQDDINAEVGYNKEFYQGVLNSIQEVVSFENNKLINWKKLLDFDELKTDLNYENLAALYKAYQIFSGKDVNLKIASTSWLQEHVDDSSKQNIELVIGDLTSIGNLIKSVGDRSQLSELIKIINKNHDDAWVSFKELKEKLENVQKFFLENEQDLLIKSVNELLALENVSELKQSLEGLLSALNKAHLLYDKHKSKFGKTSLKDLSDENGAVLEDYLKEIKKIKSFLWTLTKKSQLNSLNQRLELAFPASKLEKPHSMIPQLESEQIIYKEIVKLRTDLAKQSKFLCSLLEDSNLDVAMGDAKFESLQEKLQSAIALFGEIQDLIEKSRVLEMCSKISTNKEVLTTSKKIEEVLQAFELMELINNIDNSVTNLELFQNGWIGGDVEQFTVSSSLEKLLDKFRELQLSVEYMGDKSQVLQELSAVKTSIPSTLQKLKIEIDDISSLDKSNLNEIDDDSFGEVMTYFRNLTQINDYYDRATLSNYNMDRTLLENRYIANMTYILDKKVVEFRTQYGTDAQEIKKIIRSKSQIPKKYLRILVEAFPCLIVNIRELGEYLPLEPELFDLVIIDEASQVSIAQAFPALLRAKKIVVLGDTKQFSNVKTATASIPINNEAFSLVKENYGKDIKQLDDETKDAVKNKIYRFNIKVSILEFMQALANYQTMLLKHFRCYKEVIEYSNHNFYGGRLQVMKLRGKNIKDVIRFEVMEDSTEPIKETGAAGKIIDNANENEAKFILKELEKLAEKGFAESVGVITPFRNQQKYIYEMLRESSKYGYFEEKMKLKVMTFDSCQGEERDLVYYSMVESPSNKTRLNTIFAKELANDEEEGKLREQRLNVGFSRAKESVVFVISRQPEDFKGEIGSAIRVFKSELDEGIKLPKPSDMESEGEKKLLTLVQQTDFYKQNKEWIDIQAQFPIGEYLKRINGAEMPSYRTDFLLTYCPPDAKEISMVLEYDGFEFHFQDGFDVNGSNFDDYYVAQDIERQKALESYGYEFVRVNKFILADDPIGTLDQRFNFIVKKKS